MALLQAVPRLALVMAVLASAPAPSQAQPLSPHRGAHPPQAPRHRRAGHLPGMALGAPGPETIIISHSHEMCPEPISSLPPPCHYYKDVYGYPWIAINATVAADEDWTAALECLDNVTTSQTCCPGCGGWIVKTTHLFDLDLQVGGGDCGGGGGGGDGVGCARVCAGRP